MDKVFVVFVAILATIVLVPGLAPGQQNPAAESPQRVGDQKLWVDPRFKELPESTPRSFVMLSGGTLLTVGANATRISRDGGKSWSEPRAIVTEEGPGRPSGGLAIRTRDGAIVVVYGDATTMKWKWDEARGEAAEARMDVWSIRSLDEGKTWIDRQKIYDGHGGTMLSIIQAASGHIVLPIQPYLPNPGRWGTFTIVSADNGKTWQKSNLIDLGGAGHHDGGIESTLVELKDGRLWLLLRTSVNRLWEAYSSNHGLYWGAIGPTKIEASSAPACITRLASGRLVLVWNRVFAEGENSYPGRPPAYSIYPASWQREEISIAFSNDDGKSWTKPLAFARERGGRLIYPKIIEREPGLLWIFANTLRVSVREAELVGR
jgi:sialidase-1